MSRCFPERVLVTGADGLVGQAFLASLSSSCIDATRVVGIGRGAVPNSFSGEWGRMDLAAPDVRHRLAAIGSPDAVVHLAAGVPMSRGYDMSEGSAAVTRAIDQTIFEQVARWGVPIVYASTCGLYDPSDSGLKTEAAPTTAAQPYFAAKLSGENMVLALPRATVARLSSPVGPGLRRDLVIVRFIVAAMRGEVVPVWGTGAREQNFVSTSDIAAFIHAALASRPTGVFNVAAGKHVNMLELAHAVVRNVGSGRVRLVGTTDPGDAQRTRYCINRARAELGWRPAISIDQMITSIARELRLD